MTDGLSTASRAVRRWMPDFRSNLWPGGLLALLLAQLGPTVAHAQQPAQAYRAVYALSLAAEVPGIQAFGGSMQVEFDRTCEAWVAHTTLAFGIEANGQAVESTIAHLQTEAHDGSWLDFDVQVTRDGTSILHNRGRLAEQTDGRFALDLELPQAATLTLPTGLVLPMARTFDMLDALAEGAVPPKVLTFMPASMQVATVEAVLLQSATLGPDQAHAGDRLATGAAWIVQETYTPTSGPKANQPSAQQYVMGTDAVPLQMILDMSGLPGRLTLAQFDRATPTCPGSQ